MENSFSLRDKGFNTIIKLQKYKTSICIVKKGYDCEKIYSNVNFFDSY